MFTGQALLAGVQGFQAEQDRGQKQRLVAEQIEGAKTQNKQSELALQTAQQESDLMKGYIDNQLNIQKAQADTPRKLQQFIETMDYQGSQGDQATANRSYTQAGNALVEWSNSNPATKQMFGDFRTVNFSSDADMNRVKNWLAESGQPVKGLDAGQLENLVTSSGLFITEQGVVPLPTVTQITGAYKDMSKQSLADMDYAIKASKGMLTKANVVNTVKYNVEEAAVKAIMGSDEPEDVKASKLLKLYSQKHAPKGTKPTLNEEFEQSDLYQEGMKGEAYRKALRQFKGEKAESGEAEESSQSIYDFGKSINYRSDDFKVSDEMLDDAAALESPKSRKAYKKEIGELKALKTAFKKSGELSKKLKDPNFNAGWTATIKTAAEKAMPSGAFEGLSDQEKVEQTMKIMVNTEAGMILSDYMRSISGTAVADAEAARLSNIFSAGAYANKQAFQDAVRAFTGGIGSTIKEGAKDYFIDVPLQSLRLLEATQGKEPEAKVEKPKPFKSPKTIPTFEQFKAKFPAATEEQYGQWVASKKGA